MCHQDAIRVRSIITLYLKIRRLGTCQRARRQELVRLRASPYTRAYLNSRGEIVIARLVTIRYQPKVRQGCLKACIQQSCIVAAPCSACFVASRIFGRESPFALYFVFVFQADHAAISRGCRRSDYGRSGSLVETITHKALASTLTVNGYPSIP